MKPPPRVRRGQADPGPLPPPPPEAATAAVGPYRVLFLDYAGGQAPARRETTEPYLPELWRRIERGAGGTTERTWRRVPCDPARWDACYLEAPPKSYRFASGQWNKGQQQQRKETTL